MTTSEDSGALGDLIVVEMGDEGVQSCGKVFADLGATVIKVEPAGGVASRHRGPFRDQRSDPNASIYFWAYNTSKYSVSLDLNSSDDLSLALKLLDRADVLLEDYPVGYLESVGLGYGELSSRNPGLIYTSVSPFGRNGPLAHWKGSDLVCWAMGGGAWLLGYADMDTPPLVPQGDLAGQIAGQWAAIGVLAALEYRVLTGEGQQVDVSIQEACALAVNGYDSAPYQYEGLVPRRRDGSATIRTKDGKYLVPQMLNIPVERWAAFIKWLRDQDEGHELWNEDPAGLERKPELLGRVVQRLAETRSGAELHTLGQSFGFTWMAANAAEDLFTDPQLRHREFFQSVHHEELSESFDYPGPAAEFSEAGWRIHRRPPLLAEHNDLWLTRQPDGDTSDA